MKRCLLVVAMLLPVQAAGQVLTDTLYITITSPAVTVEVQELAAPLQRGDTVQFVAVVTDADGHPADAVLTWESSDSTRLMMFDKENGRGVALRTDAEVQAGQPGAPVPLYIWVLAEPVAYSAMGWFRPDEGPGSIKISDIGRPGREGRAVAFAEPPTVDGIGRSIQFCYYLLDGQQRLVAQSLGEVGSFCPSVFAPPPAGFSEPTRLARGPVPHVSPIRRRASMRVVAG
jgi:hypothetical protein